MLSEVAVVNGIVRIIILNNAPFHTFIATAVSLDTIQTLPTAFNGIPISPMVTVCYEKLHYRSTSQPEAVTQHG